jgi:hypothetical protein
VTRPSGILSVQDVWRRALSVVAFVLAASAASAQALGDVARQEADRRKTVKATGKVYTNDQLKPDQSSGATLSGPTPPAPTPSAPTPPAPGTGAGKNESGKPEPGGAAKPDLGKAEPAPAANDEKTWRAKSQAARDALTRAQMFAEALQSRVNGLSADFSARDDPAQRASVAADRQKSLDELERVKKEIQQHTKALSDIQDEGRKAGVPAGWLR